MPRRYSVQLITYLCRYLRVLLLCNIWESMLKSMIEGTVSQTRFMFPSPGWISVAIVVYPRYD